MSTFYIGLVIPIVTFATRFIKSYSPLNSSTSLGKRVPRHWIPHHDSPHFWKEQIKANWGPCLNLPENCLWPKCWGSQSSFDDKHTLLYELNTLQLMYSTKCQHFTLGSLYQLSLSQHGLLSLTLRWTHRLLWGKGFLDTEYRTTTPRNRWGFVLSPSIFQSFFKLFVRIFRCSFPLCVYSISQQAKFLFA